MASISARNREPRAGRPLLPADYSKFESGRRKLLSWKWAVDRLRRAHTLLDRHRQARWQAACGTDLGRMAGRQVGLRYRRE
jgi:hypothetical protein